MKLTILYAHAVICFVLGYCFAHLDSDWIRISSIKSCTDFKHLSCKLEDDQ